MDRVRFGVIGLGHNGASWCNDYNNAPQTELVAICDLDEKRLREQTTRFPDVDGYTDYSILERDDIDAISIHTPDHLHAEPFIKALEAGKHVLVEKPMANSIADLKAMLRATFKSDRKTMVGQVLRFNPHFQMLKKLCDDGHLGDIFYLEGDYIHDLRYQQHMEAWKVDQEIPIVGGGVHPLDLLRWFAGDIVAVKAEQNHIAYKEMTIPTTQTALFTFASGAIGKVTALYGPIGKMAKLYNVAVYGTKGTIVRDSFCLDGMANSVEIPYDYSGHPYSPQVTHFAEAILHDTPTVCPAEDGAKSAQACLLAYEAAITGETIKIDALI